MKISNKKFKKYKEGEIIKVGFNDSAVVWNKLIIKNTSNQSLALVVKIPHPELDEVQYYLKSKKYTAGDAVSNSPEFKETPSLPLQVGPLQTDTIFFSVRKIKSFLKYSVSVVSLQDFEKNRSLENGTNFFIVGVWLIFGTFIFLLYLFHKKNYYLFYSLNTSLLIFYLLSSTGTLKYLMFPGFNYFSEFRLIIATLIPTFFALFLSGFMSFDKHFKLGDVLIKTLSVLVWFLNLVLIFFHDWVLNNLAKPMMLTAYFCMACLVFVIFVGLIFLANKKQRNVWAVLSSFLFTLVIILILILFDIQAMDAASGNLLVLFTGSYEVVFFGALLGRDYFITLSENKQLLNKIIEEKNKTLEAYSQGEFKERKRISILLHDEFTARISAIRMMIFNKDNADAEREIASLSQLVRTSSHLTMPSGLEEGDLLRPLKNFISIVKAANPKIEIELNAIDLPEKISHTWLMDLYFSITELIQNAVKHADPNKIFIDLIYTDSNLSVSVTDDGIGYGKSLFGFGLNNISQRIKNHRGHFEISGSSNEGTTVMLVIPTSNT